MIFKGSVIGNVSLNMQRKNAGEAEFLGTLISLKPSLCIKKEPVITILEGKARTDCKQGTHYLRGIVIITGGISASTFFNIDFDNQKQAWELLAEVFVDLTKQGNVSSCGVIDWDKKVVGTGTTDIVIGSVKSTKSTASTSSTASTKTTTTTRRWDKPMYIKRKGRKPSAASLTALKKKIKAIADKTYKFKVPVLKLKEDAQSRVEIDIDETPDDMDAALWRDCGMA